MNTKNYTLQHLHPRALNTRDRTELYQISIFVYEGSCVTFSLFVDITLLGNLTFLSDGV